MKVVDNTPLARRISDLLGDRSAREISLAAGLAPDAVRNVLVGRSRSPRPETLTALAGVLGVPATALTRPDEPLHRQSTRVADGVNGR